jgi:beta-1,4-mannooligosaccharide/beta-1,4-mannosyl-N-acetylglucosamine phosphorylase
MSFRRVGSTPLITRDDLPPLAAPFDDPSSVFNPGALKVDGRIELMLRVQSRGRETCLLGATSADGRDFTVSPEAVVFEGLDDLPGKVHHVYDPRLTLLDGIRHVMLAIDLDDRCELGLARSEDGERWKFLGLVSSSEGGNRNGVLFPKRIGGRYLRLDRPNSLAGDGLAGGGDRICLSESDDLLHWRPLSDIAAGRPHYWDERIGAGPPPILTEAGWLLVYHGVATHFGSANIYQAGVVLLDAEDPGHVLGRGRNNVLEPRLPWELTGQVPNVVFPSGLVLPDHLGDAPAPRTTRCLLYYGAADTCVGLAVCTVGKLIDDCLS